MENANPFAPWMPGPFGPDCSARGHARFQPADRGSKSSLLGGIYVKYFSGRFLFPLLFPGFTRTLQRSRSIRRRSALDEPRPGLPCKNPYGAPVRPEPGGRIEEPIHRTPTPRARTCPEAGQGARQRCAESGRTCGPPLPGQRLVGRAHGGAGRSTGVCHSRRRPRAAFHKGHDTGIAPQSISTRPWRAVPISKNRSHGVEGGDLGCNFSRIPRPGFGAHGPIFLASLHRSRRAFRRHSGSHRAACRWVAAVPPSPSTFAAVLSSASRRMGRRSTALPANRRRSLSCRGFG